MAVDIFNKKKFVALTPASFTNAATATSQNIDTLGADTLVLDVVATTSDATSDPLSVLKLQEADVTNTSSFVDITSPINLVGGTALATNVGFVIPAQTATGSQLLMTFEVDTRSRKRWIRCLASPVTTMTIAMIATLGRNATMPSSTGDRNVGNYVTG